jgi:hypothetical protein
VASTYPLELVQALQWLQRSPGLAGAALTQAAEQQNWDPSIQALVVFPDLVKRLNQDITWTGPPLYYPYASWYYPGAYFGFGMGIPMGMYFGGGWGGWGGWGWSPGWGGHNIMVNNGFIHRYNFNASRGGSLSGTSAWTHDATHRGGVPYSTGALANQYRGMTLRRSSNFSDRSARTSSNPAIPRKTRRSAPSLRVRRTRSSRSMRTVSGPTGWPLRWERRGGRSRFP